MSPRPYAILAEFPTPDALLEAAHKARAAGYRRLEGFSPYPVEGLSEVLGQSEWRIAAAMLGGAGLGAVSGVLLQAGVALDFPLNVGGRPLLSWPAYALICFELAVLFSVLAGFAAMLLLNRLPRLHHPVFDLDRFSFAAQDRFFLAVLADHRGQDPDRIRAFLEGLGPVHVETAPPRDLPA